MRFTGIENINESPDSRKKNRLDKEFYSGRKVVSFNICIEPRLEFLNSDKVFFPFETILLEEAKRFFCELPLYLFMPDHIHLVTEGKNEDANCLGLLKMFKQKTGFALSKSNRPVSWQKDYYDHIVRNDENLGNLIYYILGNPVRTGIVLDWKKYKYKGSTKYNLDELD